MCTARRARPQRWHPSQGSRVAPAAQGTPWSLHTGRQAVPRRPEKPTQAAVRPAGLGVHAPQHRAPRGASSPGAMLCHAGLRSPRTPRLSTPPTARSVRTLAAGPGSRSPTPQETRNASAPRTPRRAQAEAEAPAAVAMETRRGGTSRRARPLTAGRGCVRGAGRRKRSGDGSVAAGSRRVVTMEGLPSGGTGAEPSGTADSEVGRRWQGPGTRGAPAPRATAPAPLAGRSGGLSCT